MKDDFLVIDGLDRLGYVTSVRYSPVLDQTIGLALVKPLSDFKERGYLTLLGEGKEFKARYHTLPFFDPEGERMKR